LRMHLQDNRKVMVLWCTLALFEIIFFWYPPKKTLREQPHLIK
jgi:hypothetical protein